MGGIELSYAVAQARNPDLIVTLDPLSAAILAGMLGLGFYLVGRL